MFISLLSTQKNKSIAKFTSFVHFGEKKTTKKVDNRNFSALFFEKKTKQNKKKKQKEKLTSEIASGLKYFLWNKKTETNQNKKKPEFCHLTTFQTQKKKFKEQNKTFEGVQSKKSKRGLNLSYQIKRWRRDVWEKYEQEGKNVIQLLQAVM